MRGWGKWQIVSQNHRSLAVQFVVVLLNYLITNNQSCTCINMSKNSTTLNQRFKKSRNSNPRRSHLTGAQRIFLTKDSKFVALLFRCLTICCSFYFHSILFLLPQLYSVLSIYTENKTDKNICL